MRYNFCVLALNQIVLRLGWIFKTESIIIPSFLDILGGTATTRGWLPMLSRFAIAIPPVVLAHTIRNSRRKKVVLAWLAVAMGACFLALSLGWRMRPEPASGWFIGAFFVIYTLFFACTGLNHVAFGTLQGKLIGPSLRGRLMFAANLVGAAIAIVAVWFLLPRWLSTNGGSFDFIFGFTGACFIAVAVVSLQAREPADDADRTRSSSGIREVIDALRTDSALRLTALMSALANCSIMLFPHYQALARERLDLDFTVLMSWVIIQNAGTALFSTITGPLADWWGNRAAIRVASLGLFVVPWLALFLSHKPVANAGWFGAVFFMIGLTPVYIRLIQHYTLELTTTQNHPAYLAAINVCNALPFVFSPVVGWLVSAIGFDAVFVTVNLCVFVATLLTWVIREPRSPKS